MHYKIVIFGVKDTTVEMIEYIQNTICSVDLIITINQSVLTKNHISGFSELQSVGNAYNITLFESSSYALTDTVCQEFFAGNSFDIGISMGWQRLIPEYILNRFSFGIFGFHGSCGYLPYGRGRSPLNWSVIQGDTRFILNLFQYDAKADSPNVFSNAIFEINAFDTIRTLQYKYVLCAHILIKKLLDSYHSGNIAINKNTKDFDTWYGKRSPEDGKINFKQKTRDIYNLIRGVTKPFPGAFAYINEQKITIWKAYPFDSIMDFSDYCPGEIITVFDGNLLVRTVDGSLIINNYEYHGKIFSKDKLN